MGSPGQAWYRFRASLQRRPPGLGSQEGRAGGEALRVLETVGGSGFAPFAVSFETCLGALEALPRMFCELDGSFVWVGEAEGRRWQLDGVVYDRDAAVAYVDLQGECPGEALDAVLAACGWPETELMFVLPQEGVILDEETFRAHASRKKESSE